MQSSSDDPSAPVFSRAELEIELARLALRLGRAASHLSFSLADIDAAERREALGEWYAEVSARVLSRAAPEHRSYAEARVRRIAAACSALAEEPATDVHLAGPHAALRRYRHGSQLSRR